MLPSTGVALSPSWNHLPRIPAILQSETLRPLCGISPTKSIESSDVSFFAGNTWETPLSSKLFSAPSRFCQDLRRSWTRKKNESVPQRPAETPIEFHKGRDKQTVHIAKACKGYGNFTFTFAGTAMYTSKLRINYRTPATSGRSCHANVERVFVAQSSVACAPMQTSKPVDFGKQSHECRRHICLDSSLRELSEGLTGSCRLNILLIQRPVQLRIHAGNILHAKCKQTHAVILV